MSRFYFYNDPFDGRRLLYAGTPAATPETWKKVLYQKQDVPDNYVSESCLSVLTSQPDTWVFKFWETVAFTTVASQHLSCITLFVLAWHALRWGRLNEISVIAIDVLLLLVGYVARNSMIASLRSSEDPKSPRNALRPKSLLQDVVSSCYVFATLWILSPVLKTLTSSWSEDTIYALAVFLLITHAFLHDYGYVCRGRSTYDKTFDAINDLSRYWSQVDNTLALNAGMFAAIILASRLDTVTHVFAIEFLAITGFMLLPTAQKCLYEWNSNFYAVKMTPIIVTGTTCILWGYGGWILPCLYLLLIFIVSFLCPFLFIRCHSLRTELRGPWDIAEVQAQAIEATPFKRRRLSSR